jgi:hypothetical protein
MLADISHLGRLLEKVAKPYPVVNRNSQSYARENIVSLNTPSLWNCRLSGSFRFLLHNNTDLNVCLKFSLRILPSGKFHLLTAAIGCLKLINYEKIDH